MRPLIRLDSGGYSSSWDLLPCAAETLLRCESFNERTSLLINGSEFRQWDDPLAALAWLAETASTEAPGIRWVGYLSYDLSRQFEDIPFQTTADLRLPLFCFARCNPEVPSNLRCAYVPFPPAPRREISPADRPIEFKLGQGNYRSWVKRVLEYIRAGDVFQVNLSHRLDFPLWKLPFPAGPIEIANRLRLCTPARYGAFLDFEDHAILCNSPELFFRVTTDRRIMTRPIKGTRPRMPGMDVELLFSEKDQAELNMIVDLERNDLGRVCEIGTVKVTQPRVIEEHPTVYHGAATIEGKLRTEVSFIDLLRAIFPGGSITGAPKIRAMEIIEELEPVRRGPYCGAIGYLAPGGAMEFNVAIRTMVIKDAIAYIHVGGGIVADSDPIAEYEETLVKARALFSALHLPTPH